MKRIAMSSFGSFIGWNIIIEILEGNC